MFSITPATYMVGMTGLEPTTSKLKVSCATIAPHTHLVGKTGFEPVFSDYQSLVFTNYTISPNKKPDGFKLLCLTPSAEQKYFSEFGSIMAGA